MPDTATSWDTPPASLPLPADEVHVWRASLDLPAAEHQELTQCLSGEEKARADRFHFERDGSRFAAGRGFLRHILSRYTERPARGFVFAYGEQGKPYIAGAPDVVSLSFNLTHSQGLALYAVTRDHPVGIDMEFVRPIGGGDIAERFFTPWERDELEALPDDQRNEGFFNAWTRKEAVLKATGQGLAGLNKVEVTLCPQAPVYLRSIDGSAKEASGWHLYPLVPAPGYAAALAIDGDRCRLKCWSADGVWRS